MPHSYFEWLQKFFILHSTIGRTVHSRPLNSLEHCLLPLWPRQPLYQHLPMHILYEVPLEHSWRIGNCPLVAILPHIQKATYIKLCKACYVKPHFFTDQIDNPPRDEMTIILWRLGLRGLERDSVIDWDSAKPCRATTFGKHWTGFGPMFAGIPPTSPGGTPIPVYAMQILVQYWASVADGGPILSQHWFNVLF